MNPASHERMQNEVKQAVSAAKESMQDITSEVPDTSRPAFHPLTGRPGLLSALLLLLAVMTFQPALECGFIWDDECLTENVWIRSPSGLAKLWTGAELAPKDERWWPLNYTVFAIQYQLWGLKPAAYHLVNVLIHGLNGMLIFLLLRRHLVPGAWIAGALFIVHPAHGQSAAWIMDLKTLLSTLLALLTVGLYLDFHQTRRPVPWVLALFSFSLAMLTKPSVLIIPVTLLPLIWWKTGRLRKRDFLELLPMAGVGAGMFLLGSALAAKVPHYEDPDLGLPERFLIAGRAFWYYIVQFIWPVNLMMIPPRWKVDAGSFGQYLYPVGALLAVGGICLRHRHAGRGVVAAALFFTLCLLPTLGLVRFSYQVFSFVATRYSYLADVGLVALAGAGLAGLYRASGQRWRFVVSAGTATVLLLLALLSWNQTRAFRNNITLFSRDLAINPASWGSRYILATTLVQYGRPEEARRHLEKVVAAAPSFASALLALGYTHWQSGEKQEGIQRLTEAVRVDSANAQAQFNLGIYLAETGHRARGFEHLERASRLNPDNADVHMTWGAYLAEDRRTSEALEHFREAVRLAPGHPGAQQNLRKLLDEIGAAETQGN